MILKNKKLKELEEYCKKNPAIHAFTLWDLRRERKSTDFFIDWNGEINGYMIIYYGSAIPSIIIHGYEESVEMFIKSIKLKKAIVHLPYRYINLWEGKEKKYKILVMTKKPEKIPVSDEIIEIKDFSILTSLFENPKYLVEKAKTWGIIKNGKAISSISALAYTPEVWVLGALITKKEYRNKGYATKLVSYFINYAYGRTQNIVLWVRDDNHPALDLYKKFNFKTVSEDGWINIGVNILP